jgi:hypothetical protein
MDLFDILYDPVRGYRAIKRGFSWPAFLFNFLWALSKKMWSLALIFFIMLTLFLSLRMLFELEGMQTGRVFVELLLLGFFVYIGSKANYWYRNELERTGYKYITRCKAKSSRDAVRQVNLEG